MCSLSSTKRRNPRRKPQELDLVSGGANCKQTSAVLCNLWYNSQVFNAQPADALGKNAAQPVTDSVKRFAKNGCDAPMEEWKKCKTWEAKREFALKLATDKTASFIRVTQTEALKSQSEVSDVTGWLTFGKLLTWESSLIARQTQT